MGVACLFLFLSSSLAAETETDSALWSGGLFLIENDEGLDYSMEYQLRLDDHMSSLSSHFVALMGYRKMRPALLLNGGHRFTMRPDHVENRLYFGGFWDITKSLKPREEGPRSFRAVLQIGTSMISMSSSMIGLWIPIQFAGLCWPQNLSATRSRPFYWLAC